jgi:hypothetical protein
MFFVLSTSTGRPCGEIHCGPAVLEAAPVPVEPNAPEDELSITSGVSGFML